MIDRGRGPQLTLALALVLSLAATLLYLLTAPAVVNLDGLGYLKLLPHNYSAGHLLYMPILRQATRLLGGDGLKVGRLIDAVAGGSGVLLTFGIARLVAPLRADRRFVAAVAAGGLAVSYGYWAQGADVETYALATVALLGVVRVALPYLGAPSLWRALAIGVCLGLAVLCHLTHVLLSAFVATICLNDPRGRRAGAQAAAVALGTGGAIALGAYAYAAFVVRGHHWEGAVRWVLTASHGFREGSGPYLLAEAIYGLARAVIWSPYLHEADAPRLIGQLLLGLTPILGLLLLAREHRGVLRDLPLGCGAAWIAPYAALALVFFGADSERWIFVLPALWIVAALLIDALPARRLVAAAVVGAIAVVNLVTAIAPARGDAGPRRKAELAAAPLADGDLLVFPGHSWDEYVSFYGGRRVEPFPIAYYAARDGLPQMWDRLDREAGAARARGHRVFSVRIFDEDAALDDDPAGYAELRALGLPRGALRARLKARFSVVPTPVAEGGSPEAPVARLDPAAAP